LRHADINRLEQRLRGGYPETYRAFLLNYNAGVLTPRDPAPDPRMEPTPLLCFYPLGHSYRTEYETIPSLDSMPRPDDTAVLAPLATGDADLTLYFIGLAGAFRGKVYSDDTVKSEWLGRGVPPNADSLTLPAYLARQSVRWGAPRKNRYDI
jgi:hypothetical protein